MDSGQKLIRGQDSVGANESANLEKQRKECREIDEGERAQKEPARDEAAAQPELRVEKPAKSACGSALHVEERI